MERITGRCYGKVNKCYKDLANGILTHKTFLYVGPKQTLLFVNFYGRIFYSEIEMDLGLKIKNVIFDEYTIFDSVHNYLDWFENYRTEVKEQKEFFIKLLDDVYEEYKLAGIKSEWKN